MHLPWLKLVVATILAGVLTTCSWFAPDHRLPLQPVSHLELDRFLGQWYEIATIPVYFQQHCYCTHSTFKKKGDYIEAVNLCRDGSPTGELDEVTAKAWVVPGSNNAKFRVQFIWPIKNDYWVIYLDKDYQYAIAGTPDRSYLWVLSRKPHVSETQYQFLIQKAIKQGFDLEYLKRTSQVCFENSNKLKKSQTI